MKTTKEQLLTRIGQLEHEITTLKKGDEVVRRVLSELLGSYETDYSYGVGKRNSLILLDWLGVAFKIGELKADADYAMCIEAREELRRENISLQKEITDLKYPVKP